MLVDSHCHLDFKELNENLDDVIQNAIVSGVSVLQTICTQISKFDSVYKIAQKYKNVYCSIGNHPLYLKEEGIVACETLLKNTILPKVIGVGETGLDYYHDNFDKAAQQKSFIEHIKCAQQSRLPLIIHTRSAEEDTVGILKEHLQDGVFSAVIHCFTASQWLADECVKMGFYISASGILTFKNASDIQRTFKELPEDRILIETDAPFLAPIPFRGKVNQPSYIKHTALFLAKLKQKSFEEIAQTTTDNFFRLFCKAVKLSDIANLL